jgi:hypothetical protein
MNRKALQYAKKIILLGMFLCSVLIGCSLGPKSLKGNRLDYNMSIQKSNNEELLVNLIRAKYLEPLFFLQVGSISSSFSFTAEAGLTGIFYDKRSDIFTNSLNPMVGTSYGEKPTITYTPVQGKDALKQLMEEITLDRFLILTRLGVGIESLMWLIVESFGELHNYEPGLMKGKDEPYGKFLDLAGIFGRMQTRGDIEFVSIDEQGTGIMQLRYTGPEEAEEVEKLLGINPERINAPDGKIISIIKLTPVRDLTFGIEETGRHDTVTVRFKSCFGILYDLARHVEVPEEEVERGLARKNAITTHNIINRKGLHKGLIKVRSSEIPSKDAYVSVFYRGRLYYIPDSDAESKAHFVLMGTLFSLQAGELLSIRPLLTLPVNQ